jgi:hypothetical protein
VSEHGLSRSARAFVREHVTSVGRLELLMLLHSSGGRALTADDISGALGSPVGWTRTELDELAAASVVTSRDDGWRLQPHDREVEGAIDQLARAYRTRPRELVRYIFASPHD